MKDITNFEKVYHNLFKLLKKKPVSFFFSQLPEQLSDKVITEFCENRRNKQAIILIDTNYRRLIRELSEYIRSVKMDNQLPLLETPKKTIALSEKILNKLKKEYPRAFEKRHKRTRNRYGIKQTKIDFPDNNPQTNI